MFRAGKDTGKHTGAVNGVSRGKVDWCVAAFDALHTSGVADYSTYARRQRIDTLDCTSDTRNVQRIQPVPSCRIEASTST